MRLLKTNVLLRFVNSYIVDSPQPANLSYLWNFGSLLATCLVLQILTGCFLAMHYVPNVDLAFNSVEHIMRDVDNGYILRYTHANVASFFFIFVYAHIGRGLWYGSYRSPRVLLWSIGVIILVLMMAIAFLGYLYSPKWLNNDNMIILNTLFPNAIINNFNKDKKINPVYVFDDLHTQFTKDLIKNKTSGISGIYMILNKLTLDYYIGSASTNKIYSRFANHMLYFSGSKVVKHAVQKYGISNFAFILLEIFPKTVDQQTNKELLDLEDFYLKSLLPNYNILTEAGNSFGYKHTEITRIKMKSSYSAERRLKIGLLNKDKNLSDSTIEKMRISALQRKPYNYSCLRSAAEEGLLNMKKKSKALSVFNLDGTLYGKYSSITEAAKDLNCGVKTINRSLKTEKKLLKRQWKIKLEN